MKLIKIITNWLFSRHKKQAKKKLQNQNWKITDERFTRLLIDYFDLYIYITPKQDLDTKTEYPFEFEFSIVRFRSQIGHESYAYDDGSPNSINNLRGDERFFYLQLFDRSTGFNKYQRNSIKINLGFICSIKLEKGDFKFINDDHFGNRILFSVGRYIRIVGDFASDQDTTGKGDIFSVE